MTDDWGLRRRLSARQPEPLLHRIANAQHFPYALRIDVIAAGRRDAGLPGQYVVAGPHEHGADQIVIGLRMIVERFDAPVAAPGDIVDRLRRTAFLPPLIPDPCDLNSSFCLVVHPFSFHRWRNFRNSCGVLLRLIFIFARSWRMVDMHQE
ncbi:MAG TPA: hypothetical protein VME41_06710 [Stellaceae bacterium]|nr:hypothetical protein [Stellaceae bacterium]